MSYSSVTESLEREVAEMQRSDYAIQSSTLLAGRSVESLATLRCVALAGIADLGAGLYHVIKSGKAADAVVERFMPSFDVKSAQLASLHCFKSLDDVERSALLVASLSCKWIGQWSGL